MKEIKDVSSQQLTNPSFVDGGGRWGCRWFVYSQQLKIKKKNQIKRANLIKTLQFQIPIKKLDKLFSFSMEKKKKKTLIRLN